MDRSKPPATPGLPPYKLPPVFETRLANGLTVLLVEDRRFPLVTLRLGFPSGSKFDPAELRGLSETTAALLTEGTVKRTARQIAEEATEIGGMLHADSSADVLVLAASALAEHFERLLELTADVARNSSFPEDEVALRKQNRKQELAAQRSDAGYLADEKFAEVVYGLHPYARQEPTPESIDRLDRGALADFRDRHLTPGDAVLVVLGALPPRERMLDAIAARFGDWARQDAVPSPSADFPAPARTVTLVDRPGSVQADIRIGRLAVTRTDPDYFPLVVANTILGGGASSRLFANVREKMGYAYDVHSAASPLRDAGTFSVVTQVRNEVVEPAIAALVAEMKQMAAAGVSPDEVATAANYLSGVFVIRLETQDGVASQLTAVRLLGLPLDYLEQYTARIQAVTAEQVRAAAARYIEADCASIVVVGDGAQISKQLETFRTVR
jgi:zinc protease